MSGSDSLGHYRRSVAKSAESLPEGARGPSLCWPRCRSRTGHDPDPRPDDPISIRREEFDEACERLAEAGVPLHHDRDQAWRDYAGWRVNYDTVLLALADLIMAPYSPWTSDRSVPGPTRPPDWPLGSNRSPSSAATGAPLINPIR